MPRGGFVNPGAAAGNAIQEFLAQRELQNRQRMIDELMQQRQVEDMDLRQRQMGLQESQEARIGERQAAMDAEASETRQREQSEAANAAGMRRFTGDAMKMPGIMSTPEGAASLAGDIYGEGGEIPGILQQAMKPAPPDPSIARAASLEDYEAKKRIDQQYERPPASGGGGSPEQQWVIRNGQPVPIPKGTAQAGDQPYDAVAARSAQPQDTAEAIDTAREVSRLASALKGHAGVGGTFGKWSSQMPQWAASQDTADSRTLLNSLKGLLTIENMGKMKGVLSDADMRVLQQASTTLDASMSEGAAGMELDRLVEVMGKITGGQAAAGSAGTSGRPPSRGSSFRVVGQR